VKTICRLFLLVLGLCLSTLAGAQGEVTLLVKSDVDCNWKLDGKAMSLLKADESTIVPVSPGEHRIRAVTTDAMTEIRIEAEVDQGQKIVEIQMKDEHDRELKSQQEEKLKKQAEAEVALHPTWTDPDTRLMWARKDNHSNVTWNEASDYCAKLQLAGYNDWRLPTIEELQSINDPSVSIPYDDGDGAIHVSVKGNLKLTGSAWSSSPGQEPDSPLPKAQALTFYRTEEPVSFPTSDFFVANMRALCVRRSNEVTLLIKSDIDCNWKLDGRPMDPLKADGSMVIPVSPGEHRIRAVTTDAMTEIRIEADVDQVQKTVEIQMKDEHDRELKRQQEEKVRKQAEAEAALHPTWTDPNTALMWAKKDNGSDVNWSQASDYCTKLQLAGYNDWRLPTIEELEGIYDPSISAQAALYPSEDASVHVKGNLMLTGWDWSSPQEQYPRSLRPGGRFFHFDQTVEHESSRAPLVFSDGMRALCVRRSGE